MWFGPDNCSRDNPTAKPKHFARRQHRAGAPGRRFIRVEMALSEVSLGVRHWQAAWHGFGHSEPASGHRGVG